MLGALVVAATSCTANASRRAAVVVSATARLSQTPAPGAVNSLSSIEAFSADGSLVELADGSVWFVAAGDRSTVMGWSVGDTTNIMSSGQLTDVDSGDVVSATLVGQARRARTYTAPAVRRLLAMVDNGTLLALSDGSVWALSARGAPSIADRWPLGSGVRVSRRAPGAYTLADTHVGSRVPATYVGAEP